MKKWMLYFATFLIVAVAQQSCKGKPSDAELQTAANDALAKITGMGTPPLVSVKEGVATLTGEVKDEGAKSAFATSLSGIKGIKEVKDQTTVAPPPTTGPAPVEIAADDALTKAVGEVVKDYGSVKAEVKDGVVTLKGEIKRSDLQKLIMTLNGLKPKKIDNQLTIK